MKTFTLKTWCIIALLTFSFASCTSDDDDTNSSSSGDEYLTAKIDGADYAASKDPATIIGATKSNGILAVQGGDNSGNTISFQIMNYNGTGSYNTGDNLSNTSQIMYITISPIANWGSNLATAALGTLSPGTITVTSDDGSIVEGTFEFEGYNASTQNSKNITNGKFKAELN